MILRYGITTHHLQNKSGAEWTTLFITIWGKICYSIYFAFRHFWLINGKDWFWLMLGPLNDMYYSGMNISFIAAIHDENVPMMRVRCRFHWIVNEGFTKYSEWQHIKGGYIYSSILHWNVALFSTVTYKMSVLWGLRNEGMTSLECLFIIDLFYWVSHHYS